MAGYDIIMKKIKGKKVMNCKKRRALGMLFSLLAIGLLLAHLWLLYLDADKRIDDFILSSLPLLVVPYGLPIFVFTWSAATLCKAQPRWQKSDSVFLTLFSLVYFVMAGHVTAEWFFSKESFANIFFNLPVVYTLPLLFVGIVWLWLRMKPPKHSPFFGKFLYILPLLLFVAAIVHCGILSFLPTPPGTSAPWWVMPLMYGLGYLGLALLCMVILGIYRFAQKRKTEGRR